MLVNGVNLMHRLNRCRLRLQKRTPEERQLGAPNQLMKPKNLLESIHHLFQGL